MDSIQPASTGPLTPINLIKKANTSDQQQAATIINGLLQSVPERPAAPSEPGGLIDVHA